MADTKQVGRVARQMNVRSNEPSSNAATHPASSGPTEADGPPPLATSGGGFTFCIAGDRPQRASGYAPTGPRIHLPALGSVGSLGRLPSRVTTGVRPLARTRARMRSSSYSGFGNGAGVDRRATQGRVRRVADSIRTRNRTHRRYGGIGVTEVSTRIGCGLQSARGRETCRALVWIVGHAGRVEVR